MTRLNERQKRFAAEYLVDLNATRAAKRAGYTEKGAARTGRRLLKNEEVQAVIRAAIQERQRRVEITQDQVVAELAEIAFKKATDDSKTDLKYTNKLRALELLGKHLGMFDNRNAAAATEKNNLFEIIQASTSGEVDTSAIPEIEPTAEPGHDVVEQAGL